MSSQGLHPKDSELRINMINSKLVSNYVKYKQFQITTGATNCILLVGGFRATSKNALKSQNQQMFSTYVMRCVACNFTKSNTLPWVFFMFLKFYKWYQIAQRITYLFFSVTEYFCDEGGGKF